jgi:hypothetical protein
MVTLSATRCSYIAVLLVSLMSFAAITLCVASQRAIPKVSVYFVIGSVRELLEHTLVCWIRSRGRLMWGGLPVFRVGVGDNKTSS